MIMWLAVGIHTFNVVLRVIKPAAAQTPTFYFVLLVLMRVAAGIYTFYFILRVIIWRRGCTLYTLFSV